MYTTDKCIPFFAGSRRRTMMFSRYSLISLLLLQTSKNASCFVPQNMARGHSSPSLNTQLLDTQPMQSSSVDTSESSPVMSQLPDLFPSFAEELVSNGFITPTPIQQSSGLRAKDGENLLLIAATGSGKTLAYLLPALSRACDNQEGGRKTVVICAPTRELSAQLARDASILLPDEGDTPNVLLAVRSIPPPTPIEMANAQVLIGTPNELYAVLTRISGAQNFIAGDTLSSFILDEVDVLLPVAPKTLRTSFDKNDAKNERRAREQKRKLRAAQRRGVEFQGGSNKKAGEGDGQMLTPTEKLLRLIASARFVGGDDKDQVQVLAGSATASRTTLDRLNKALRSAAKEVDIIGSDGLQGAWKGNMKACRPENTSNTGEQVSAEPEDSTHTIRAVTVPSVVDHRFVSMPKSDLTNPQVILSNVAKVSKELKPESALLFICGEFSRSLQKEKKKEAPKVTGKTAQARRDAQRRSVFMAKQKAKDSTGTQSSGPQPLSVRKTCSFLQSLGVDAQPMHVVLGLEPNAKEGEMAIEEEDDANELAENEVDLPQLLVTFEGSARGLHFDGVDVIFVVGRPTSAASYLHLAGRVGRTMANDGSKSEVEVRPGTIISFCSKGRVTELEKWTNQIGGTKLEELNF
ncbi:ATP-dependent RNA helicase [Skeletonema marinoi]|uniref:ATP-dependent RNA helicase n=2 Tax=Skeletonema marinoi TaxID=267567 RepID=A0AAD8YKE9_9STRA|nr:ATP-dependent RNA helicase [Skeletonema marinoi]